MWVRQGFVPNFVNIIIKIKKTVMSKETGKRGRPVVAGSARQTRLDARAQRAAQGLSTGRGRPASQTSARQAKLAAKAAKIAAGIEIKRGAPKKQKSEPAMA
jgi:hypothetical protein